MYLSIYLFKKCNWSIIHLQCCICFRCKKWFSYIICVCVCLCVCVHIYQFSSVQSLSRVQAFATPWMAARQASLSITNSWSLLKPMSIESVMPSNHLILSSPSPPAPNPSQHQGLFQWVSSLHEVSKYWSFSLSISLSNEHPGLILFSMNWLDLLAVQETLKSLLQYHSSRASIFQCSAFFTVQLSHP